MPIAFVLGADLGHVTERLLHRSVQWTIAIVLLLALAKRWLSGAKNVWERDLHGRVIIVTGGTSGIGWASVCELAQRGAQLVLLTQESADQVLVEQIDALRESSGNELIYVETCNLASLRSIRKFATRWIDNKPPRRLDMVLCCAGVLQPVWSERRSTLDGLESHWGVNFYGHMQLLEILAPALRVQPAERDVRVVILTCSLHALSLLPAQGIKAGDELRYPTWAPYRIFADAKLALMAYARVLQHECNIYARPDRQPNGVSVLLVDPGTVRTPGLRRFVSMGSIWGLIMYTLCYPIPWFLFKSGSQGAQSVLHAAMCPEYVRSGRLTYVQECTSVPIRKAQLQDQAYCEAVVKNAREYMASVEKASAASMKK